MWTQKPALLDAIRKAKSFTLISGDTNDEERRGDATYKLQAELEHVGYTVYIGMGYYEGQEEMSLLVIDLPPAMALLLASEYGQEAVLVTHREGGNGKIVGVLYFTNGDDPVSLPNLRYLKPTIVTENFSEFDGIRFTFEE